MAPVPTCKQRRASSFLSPVGRAEVQAAVRAVFSTILSRAVAANCLDRATFHRLFTQGFFFRRFGLFINVGMAAVVIATEVRGSGFTAKIAVDALVIDIELSVDIFGVFICDVSHFSKLLVESRGN